MFDLKVVIIGGSIAGLGVALALKRAKKKVVIREKDSIDARPGLAFLINSKTLEDIQSITDTALDIANAEINKFILINDCENKQNKNDLTGWYALQRIELLKFLRSHLSDNEYYENSEFSHFKYKGDKVIAAIFKDGSIEYGDLFIGADGINSRVRKSVCEAQFFPNKIDELVCFVKHKEKFPYDATFRKYQIKKGMSFGLIPISKHGHIWFFQFDIKLYGNIFQKSKGIVNGFSSQFLAELPKDVRELIDNSDLKKAYLWNNQELKLLSSYYKANICLIGDAVHGSISLTSSGVSSGISSAIKLAQVLNESESLQSALDKYEKDRKKENSKIIEHAHILKAQFNSSPISIENYYLPLFR